MSTVVTKYQNLNENIYNSEISISMHGILGGNFLLFVFQRTREIHLITPSLLGLRTRCYFPCEHCLTPVSLMA